jgi:hypothetical protein
MFAGFSGSWVFAIADVTVGELILNNTSSAMSGLMNEDLARKTLVCRILILLGERVANFTAAGERERRERTR